MQAIWSFSVSNALWLCADRGAFNSASAVNLPVQTQYGLPYLWPWTCPVDVDDEVFLFSEKCLVMRCYIGWGYKRDCISILLYLSSHASSWLHGRCIWCYWRAETGMRITSADFEGLYETSHTAHVLACVLCQISLLVAWRSWKLSSGFQVNLLQTLSVCPEGPAFMKNHQSHTIEALLLTAVSISPFKLP